MREESTKDVSQIVRMIDSAARNGEIVGSTEEYLQPLINDFSKEVL